MKEKTASRITLLRAVRMSALAPPVSGLYSRLGGSPHRRTIGVRATARTRASRAWRSPWTSFSTTPFGAVAPSSKKSRRREVTTRGIGFPSPRAIPRGIAFRKPNTGDLNTRSENVTRVVPNAFPPERRLDDVELMKGDAVVLWLFCLSSKAAAECFAPNFPGWLAPVTLDAVGFLSFLVETIVIVAAWLGASSVVGAYEIKAVGKDSEEGEMVNAVNGVMKSWVAFCPLGYFGVGHLRESLRDVGSTTTHGLTNLHGFPVLTTLSLVLLVMLSWRAYVKVIGLMGWWRPGRLKSKNEDDAYVYLRNAQTLAVVLALSFSVLDFYLGHVHLDDPSF